MDAREAGLLRALCFFDAIGYPPTIAELLTGFDAGRNGSLAKPDVAELSDAFHSLIVSLSMIGSRGRLAFPGRESLFEEHERREGLFPRKIRRARRFARWFASLSGVRFVALCNTTALAHARDGGDLDFFVIAERGVLWQTRGWATLPCKVLGLRPAASCERDAACLSFFIDDRALDLAPLTLPVDDPYFRHWFLSLLPLYDDGVSRKLWDANARMTARHPFARPWIANPDRRIRKGGWRIPAVRAFESLAHRLQASVFPPSIKHLMNQDTRVVVNDRILKFHADDGREAFRCRYRENCQRYGIEA